MKMFQTISSGRAGEGEIRIVKRSGEIIWLHITAEPGWDNQQREITGIVGVGSDITARKRLEEQLAMEKKKKLKKRRYKRYQLDNYWSKLDGLDTYEIKDISIGGVCLRASQKLPDKDMYDIKIYPSINGGVVIKGNVVWSSVVGGDMKKGDRKAQYEVGMEFIELSEELKGPLKKFLRKLAH
jgi:hypothetical protein